MRFGLFLAMLVFLFFAGCATARNQTVNLEIQQLQLRVRRLEKEVQQKDRKISDLEYELQDVRTESKRVKEVKIYPEKKREKIEHTKSYRIPPKNIQVALKKVGFYNGPIDGKIGKGTKKAIMEFQKANGLKPDGIVGPKTWSKLSKFSE